MGAKADRIDALEADIDRHEKRIAALTNQAAELLGRIEAVEAQANRPGIVDTARREFHDRWSWLLDAAGI